MKEKPLTFKDLEKALVDFEERVVNRVTIRVTESVMKEVKLLMDEQTKYIINYLTGEFNDTIDGLIQYMDGRFNRIDGRFDRFEQRLEGNEKHLKGVDSRVTILEREKLNIKQRQLLEKG